MCVRTACYRHIDPNNQEVPRVTYSGTNERQSYNDVYQMHDVQIADARASPENFKLHQNGFEKAYHALVNPNFDDESWIKGELYKDVEKIMKEKSGASDVFIFDHTTGFIIELLAFHRSHLRFGQDQALSSHFI